MYDLLVDELEADPTLLNIRGETVGPGMTTFGCESSEAMSPGLSGG